MVESEVLNEERLDPLKEALKRAERSNALGFDPYEAQENAYTRLDAVDRANKYFYNTVSRKYYELNRSRRPLLLWYELFNKAVTRAYLKLKKLPFHDFKWRLERLAIFVFSVEFIKYTALKKVSEKTSIATEYIDVIRNLKTIDHIELRRETISAFDRIVQIASGLIVPDQRTREHSMKFKQLFYEIVNRPHIDDVSRWMIDNLDVEWASHTPLGDLVVTSILKNYQYPGRIGFWGKRVGVYAPLGGGKTSFAFYSMYSAFRYVGLDDETSRLLAGSLITNNPVEIAYILLGALERRVQLPAFVPDDLVASVSKYWFQDKAMRELGRELFKVLKISRENFGILIFPADTHESVPKALRESVDLVIQGESFPGLARWYDYTVFAKTTGTLAIRSQQPKNPFIGEEHETHLSSKMMVTRVETLVAGVHPPMFIPTDIYLQLQETKQALKKQSMMRVAERSMRLFEEHDEEEY